MAALDGDVGVAQHEGVGALGALGHADDLGDLAVDDAGFVADDERDAGVWILRAQCDRSLGGAVLVARDGEEEIGARVPAFEIAGEVGEQAGS